MWELKVLLNGLRSILMGSNSFKNITLIAYDFDGVMTDNKVYVDTRGKFNVSNKVVRA